MFFCLRWRIWVIGCFFFFQAEDGIRDYKVTGVQTCALPIFGARSAAGGRGAGGRGRPGRRRADDGDRDPRDRLRAAGGESGGGAGGGKDRRERDGGGGAGAAEGGGDAGVARALRRGSG